jgi:hypothetical protein
MELVKLFIAIQAGLERKKEEIAKLGFKEKVVEKYGEEVWQSIREMIIQTFYTPEAMAKIGAIANDIGNNELREFGDMFKQVLNTEPVEHQPLEFNESFTMGNDNTRDDQFMIALNNAKDVEEKHSLLANMLETLIDESMMPGLYATVHINDIMYDNFTVYCLRSNDHAHKFMAKHRIPVATFVHGGENRKLYLFVTHEHIEDYDAIRTKTQDSIFKVCANYLVGKMYHVL